MCIRDRDMPIEELKVLYKVLIPISRAKYNDLQYLTRFLINPEAKSFYNNLTWNGHENNEQHDDVYFDFISDNDD